MCENGSPRSNKITGKGSFEDDDEAYFRTCE